MMTNGLNEQALQKLLQDTLILLDNVAETFWSSKIRRALRSIDLAEVLSWYGGMGSFNDLVIAGVNGHQVGQQQEPAINARLEDLRNRIYELASQLNA